jgi:hypothetical protein
VNIQAAEREKWNCEILRTENVRMLQEELQKTLRRNGELKVKKRGSLRQVTAAGVGKSDEVHAK